MQCEYNSRSQNQSESRKVCVAVQPVELSQSPVGRHQSSCRRFPISIWIQIPILLHSPNPNPATNPNLNPNPNPNPALNLNPNLNPTPTESQFQSYTHQPAFWFSAFFATGSVEWQSDRSPQDWKWHKVQLQCISKQFPILLLPPAFWLWCNMRAVVWRAFNDKMTKVTKCCTLEMI